MKEHFCISQYFHSNVPGMDRKRCVTGYLRLESGGVWGGELWQIKLISRLMA